MICRHGILGRRSRERRVAATKVARPRGKKEGERQSLRNRRIGRFKGEKRETWQAWPGPANAAERVVPIRAFWTATASLYLPLSAPVPIFLPSDAKISVTWLPFDLSVIADFFPRPSILFIRRTPWIRTNNGGQDDKSSNGLQSDRENCASKCLTVSRALFAAEKWRENSPCRPRVENYFDLERTRRVIFLFGIHFMLVLTKSNDGSSNRHGSCLPEQIQDTKSDNFIDRIQFRKPLELITYMSLKAQTRFKNPLQCLIF